MALPQLFGIIPTGHPPITTPTSAPTPTTVLYTLPARPATHIVVFLLPGASLPPNTAAAVYLQLPPQPGAAPATAPEYRFLGGIGPGKESAVFRTRGLEGGAVVGIAVEEAGEVAARMATLPPPSENSNAASTSNTDTPPGSNGGADAAVLAQRIIKNAFLFLAGYAGNTAGGVEVVPLKAFEEWWRKFEGRVRADPGFLQREAE